MKTRYFTFLLLLIANFGYALTTSDPTPLTATITGGTTVCQNGAQPLVTFTGSGGTAPYTFVYKINGGSNLSVSSIGTNSAVTIDVNTATATSLIYTLVSVQGNTGAAEPETGSTTVIVSLPPTVDFTFSENSACSGTSIQFNSTVSGTGFTTYSWNFNDGTPLSSAANPSHVFTALGCGNLTFNVVLTVTKNGCTVVRTKPIIVKQRPDINFVDVSNAFDPFNNCSNASSNAVYSVTVGNSSASTCVTSYTINWGDGNTENNVTFPKSHIYNQLGAYTMTITALGANGCSNSKSYIIKNVSNPLGGLNSPGATQNLCAPTANLQFSISNWGTNSLDTTYSADYGDGTTLFLTQGDLNASTFYNVTNPGLSANFPIPHVYTASNCPVPSYEVKLIVTNVCGPTPFSVGNITILTKPEADFTVPNKACVNSPVLFTNTTISGFGLNCNLNSIYKWNFGDGTPVITTSTGVPQNITHIYTTPATYSITLIAEGFCGITTTTKTICIEPPLTPLFTLNTNAGCAPLAVTATNTTNLASQCETPTYLWEVSYAAGFCGTSVPAIANQTTANATFNFTEAGTYTITLTTTNSCGNTTTSKTVEVRKPPVISINPIANSCVNSSITPVAVVPTCATASGTVTYAWSFPGGNPATATTANPGNISYAASGSYTVSLVVTNSCGASNTATQTFTVNPTPTMTNTVLAQTICSGAATTPIVLTTTPAGATFSWTATATAGISGFITSGTTATIPAQTITTSNASAGTITYTITPTIGTCTGIPVDYVITVNPAPTISTQPIPSTICLNGIATPLNVVVNSSLGVTTYQWYSNTINENTDGMLIFGATSATYIPPTNVVDDVYYYCDISLPSGGCSSLTSAVALVQVVASPIVTTQPIATQNICVGTVIASPLSVIATGGTGTISYQWFSDTLSATTGGIEIPGATASTYSPPTFTVPDTFYYYVTVTYSGNNCGTVTSQIAVVNVSTDPTTTQPLVSQNLCQGSTPTTLEVTATGGNGTFNYQWYQNTANNITFETSIPGATNASYIPPTNAVGTLYYYCVITQSTLGCGVTSNTAAVIINPSPSVSVQPIISTACLGGSLPALTLTVSNGAGTPAYQWFSNTINSNTPGTLLTGETNATFMPPSSVIGTLFYYCSVTFSAISGSCSTVQTNTAEVIITAAATIDQNPLATQILCIGVTIPNPLTATFIGGTGTPTYQWFSNANNSSSGGIAIFGATGATYSPPVFSTAGIFYYYLEITLSGNGCSAIKSNAAEIVIVNDPTIATQPLITQTLCQNATPTTLSVTASGGIGNTYSYQWYSSPTNTIIGGMLISSATTNTFSPPTDVVGTLFYYCVISQAIGSGCNVTSNTAEVIINAAPAISAQPQNGTYCVNQTSTPLAASFINGIGTPTYQWFSNSINSNSGENLIAGQTSSSFTPPTVTAGNVYYYCEITFSELVGGCEIIISATALITVNLFAIIASESDTICSSNAFSIIPTDGNGNMVPTGTTYTWLIPTVTPAGSLTGFSAQALPQTEISQTLVNTTTNPVTITYAVTPISGICVGSNFTVSITVNPSIDSNVTVTNNACFGVNNASITTNITGGVPPYMITWTGPNGFSSAATTISNMEPGTYTITIDDAGNCPFNNSYTITQPNDILIITNSQTNSTCFESNDGTIDLSVSGGIGQYTYSWTKDSVAFAATQDLANLSPGVYTVTVTDANSCGPKTQTFTITEP
jgi:PKD repeat protein